MFRNFDGKPQVMNLGDYSDEEINIMKENKIEFRKLLSQLISSSRKESKSDSCYYCGQKGKKFCTTQRDGSIVLFKPKQANGL